MTLSVAETVSAAIWRRRKILRQPNRHHLRYRCGHHRRRGRFPIAQPFHRPYYGVSFKMACSHLGKTFLKLDNRQSPWRKRLDRYVGIPLIILMALIRKILCLKVWGPSGPRKRILVIKLSALGDVVLMLPALYRLRETHPDSEIVFLGGSSNAEFLRLCKGVSRVETFSVKTCFKLFKKTYDLVIDFDQWVRATALVSSVCVARQTYGFRTTGQSRHFAFDHVLTFERSQHMARNFWNLAAFSLEKGGIRGPWSFEADRDAARSAWGAQLIKAASHASTSLREPYAVIHPGCGEKGQAREWPLESWKNLIHSLKISHPKLQIVITGKGPREKEWGNLLASQDGVISKVNELNLSQLIKALSHADWVMASNTGVMHLADYVNDSVFVLEGPTDSALWGPIFKGRNIESPLACSPCLTWGSDYGCSDPVCVKAISPAQVFEALEHAR